MARLMPMMICADLVWFSENRRAIRKKEPLVQNRLYLGGWKALRAFVCSWRGGCRISSQKKSAEKQKLQNRR